MARGNGASLDAFLAGEKKIGDGAPYWESGCGYNATVGRTLRAQTTDPTKKTLVLIVAGQSNFQSIAPSAYSATNATKIDNLNVYDGAIYAAAEPLLGCSWAYQALGGSGATPSPGNIGMRVADTLITNGKFDRVILAPIAVGESTAADWASGVVATRFPATIARLAARGITPSSTGVTFAVNWGQGESDHGTSQANYAAAMGVIIAQVPSTVRWFINKQTWNTGAIDTNVQASQAALPNGTNVFAGANADSLNATNRQTDNTHFNDTGMAALAALMITAMGASGLPF